MARRVRVVASFLILGLVLSPASSFGQPAANPKALLAEGDKAGKAKDWKKALESYEAANKAQPSQEALAGIAAAHYNLKHDAEAYEAYAKWLELYAAKVPARKAAMEARLKELAGRTAPVTINVNEAGAKISIDDRQVGVSPLPAPVRLGAGSHRVHVQKDGFLPFDLTRDVVAGTPATVDVKLEAQATKGRLVVREKSGKPIRVLVDDVDVGETTWAGEVTAGEHVVAGRTAQSAAPPQKVTVERGKTHEVELVATTTTAPLKIATSDGKGLIYIDDKLVGEGTYSSELPTGPHKIRVTREGYDTFEEEIVLEPNTALSRTVTLNLASNIETGKIEMTRRLLEGIYGGFQIGGTLMPGGNGSSPQKSCEEDGRIAEIVDCDAGTNLGATLGGFFGYHWDPVGVELFLAGGYDTQSPFLQWRRSAVDPGIGPDPDRREDFTIRRLGGLAALRVRLTLGGEKLRFTTAGGVGISLRSMFLVREVSSTIDPSLPGTKLVEEGVTYTSPVLSLEPAAVYRVTPTVGIMLGLSLAVENPRVFSDVPRSEARGDQRLGPSGVTTPAYDLASGTQTYLGLFAGMMFGP